MPCNTNSRARRRLLGLEAPSRLTSFLIQCIEQVDDFERGLSGLEALQIGARQRLLIGVGRQDAVADRNAHLELNVRNAGGRLVRDEIEVIGLTANDGTE